MTAHPLVEVHAACTATAVASVDGNFVLVDYNCDTAVRNVVAADVAPSGDAVAVATADKAVYVLQSSRGRDIFRKVAHHKLPKRPTAVKFASPPIAVVVSDAFGDLYRVPTTGELDLTSDTAAEAETLLGHFSTITHFAMTNSELATGDRDARVRLSRWPDAFVIRNFSLGHTDVVTSLCFVGDYLVSASLDGSLRLWDSAGRCVDSRVPFPNGSAARTATPPPPPAAGTPNSSNASDAATAATPNSWAADTTARCGTAQPTPILTLAPHPFDHDSVFFIAHGARSVHQLSGISAGHLSCLSVFRTLGDTVTGMTVDPRGYLWVSLRLHSNLRYFSIADETSDNEEDAVQDSSGELELNYAPPEGGARLQAYVGRFEWLMAQRKKPMVENWKGKKRRHEEV